MAREKRIIEHWKGFECVGRDPAVPKDAFGARRIPLGCKCISEERCREPDIWLWVCEERQYTYYSEVNLDG